MLTLILLLTGLNLKMRTKDKILFLNYLKAFGDIHPSNTSYKASLVRWMAISYLRYNENLKHREILKILSYNGGLDTSTKAIKKFNDLLRFDIETVKKYTEFIKNWRTYKTTMKVYKFNGYWIDDEVLKQVEEETAYEEKYGLKMAESDLFQWEGYVPNTKPVYFTEVPKSISTADVLFGDGFATCLKFQDEEYIVQESVNEAIKILGGNIIE
jgi:hypothetical protein